MCQPEATRSAGGTMDGQSSNTTLHSVPQVAKVAGITRQTLYNWMNTGLVEPPTWDVDGRSVFTNEERDNVITMAKERAALFTQIKLSNDPG